MNQDLRLPFHRPVLLSEVMDWLQIKPGIWYIDATVGGGGHTQGILLQGGYVLGIDQDQEAIAYTTTRLKTYIQDDRLRLKRGNFTEIRRISRDEQISEFGGILFDLGMSTYQIKQSGRGFSFLKDELLDMRMSQDAKLTAEEVVNAYSLEQLYEIFRKFGEEHLARQIAMAICRSRTVTRIRTTGQLAEIAHQVYKEKKVKSRIHPATRIFQAVRIEVNDELTKLKKGLQDGFELLSPKGRLLVISFHSLEDRIVKRQFLEYASLSKIKILTKKPITATDAEIEENAASRSAKLRVIEKV